MQALDDGVREIVQSVLEPVLARLADLERQLAEVRADNRLLSVEEFCRRHPEWTPGAVRWLVFNRKSNGLDVARAVVQPTGKRGRVRIDPEEFLRVVSGRKSGRLRRGSSVRA